MCTNFEERVLFSMSFHVIHQATNKTHATLRNRLPICEFLAVFRKDPKNWRKERSGSKPEKPFASAPTLGTARADVPAFSEPPNRNKILVRFSEPDGVPDSAEALQGGARADARRFWR